MITFASRKDMSSITNALIADVSSYSKDKNLLSLVPSMKILGGITIDGVHAISTECMWQGLKDFGDGPSDLILRGNVDYRTVKGKKPLGHRLNGELITDAAEARKKIYVQAYNQQLHDDRCRLALLRLNFIYQQAETQHKNLVLLDQNANGDIDDPAPFAHAAILVAILRNYNGQDANNSPINIHDATLYNPIDQSNIVL